MPMSGPVLGGGWRAKLPKLDVGQQPRVDGIAGREGCAKLLKQVVCRGTDTTQRCALQPDVVRAQPATTTIKTSPLG